MARTLQARLSVDVTFEGPTPSHGDNLDGLVDRWLAVLAALLAVAVVGAAWIILRRRRGRPIAFTSTELIEPRAPSIDPTPADEAVPARRRYMAQVGDEIRTPIADIIATLDLLQRSSLTPAQLRLVELALSSGNALLGKVNQVLEVARIEFDRESIVVEPVDLAAQVRAGALVHAAAASARLIPLGLHVAPRPFPMLVTDGMRVRQIVSNLVADAVAHGGPIDVHLRARRAPEAGRWLTEVEVSFNGGAEPAAGGHPDAPGAADDDPGDRTNGLGLWVCKELAQLIGGRIETWTSPGDGSRYGLLLTLAEVPQAEPCDGPVFEDLQAQLNVETRPGPIAAAIGPSGKMAVLLVEDDRINRFLGVRLLEAAGFEVDVFDDAREALAHWRRYAHPVVVTDCILKPFDGHQLAREIRAAEASAGPGRARCVIVGVSASESERARALASGMDDFLAKPLTLQALRRAIQSRLGAASGA